MNASDKNFGAAFNALNRGDFSQAELLFSQFVKANPNHFGALNLLTLALIGKEKFEEAESTISRALAIDQNSDASFYNYGVILKQLGKPDQALVQFERAVKLNPKHVKAWNNRGACFNDLGQYEHAICEFDRTISLNPSYFEAYYNKGNALSALYRHEQACDAFAKALAINPASAESHNNRGMALHELGRIDEALTSYDKAIAMRANYADAHWNRGLSLLLSGEFEKGWHDYEWRNLRKRPSRQRPWTKPLWVGGEDVSGKTILVHSEQGLGDTIHFCRYVDLLCDVGARVLFAPQRPLQALMRTIGDRFEIVDVEDDKLDFDFCCPLLSLPLAFKTRLETIPKTSPYLKADPERIARWAKRMGSEGFKVGVCWQGSPGKVDAGRSFPLAQFFEISRIPHLRLINLHKGEGLSQLNELPNGMRVETLGEEFDAGADAFLDTAAVMTLCDLVITSDTAVAHLAGALAAPTWVALKRLPDWRWMLDRADSPWYPTMRLFRQSVRDDWNGVFVEIERELRGLVGG